MPIIEAKKDCFAYDAKRRECGVCTSMICKERCACPFYKTKEALELARRKSAQRILDVSGVNPQVARVVNRYGMSPQRLAHIIGKASSDEGGGIA